MSNFIGPELVDIIAAIVSMIGLVAFLREWKPKQVWASPAMRGNDGSAHEAQPPRPVVQHSPADLVRAWWPWAILTVFVFTWGLPPVKIVLNGLVSPKSPIKGLPNLNKRVSPVVPTPHPEAALYTLNLLSAAGTGILLAAIISALVMNYKLLRLSPKLMGAANSSRGVMNKMNDAEHRRRQHRDALVQQGRRDPAPRHRPRAGAVLPGGPGRHAAGL